MGRKRKKVLVVEDEPELVNLFEIRLKAEDLEVLTAGDGEEGLRIAKEENPDLILLDLMLPGMDGLTACRMLKREKEFRHIPVIMLTAKAEKTDEILGLSAGADAYIVKPFDWRDLFKKIKELLEKNEVS